VNLPSIPTDEGHHRGGGLEINWHGPWIRYPQHTSGQASWTAAGCGWRRHERVCGWDDGSGCCTVVACVSGAGRRRGA